MTLHTEPPAAESSIFPGTVLNEQEMTFLVAQSIG